MSTNRFVKWRSEGTWNEIGNKDVDRTVFKFYCDC